MKGVLTDVLMAIGEAFRGSMWPSKPIEIGDALWLALSRECPGPGGIGEGIPDDAMSIVVRTAGGCLEFRRAKPRCAHCKQVLP